MAKPSTASSLRPSFVPEALWTAKPSFAWKGELAHIGPTHTANALYKKLARHSWCGSLALFSGVLSWGASVFAAVRDVGPHLELARIHFLVMEPLGFRDVDWRGLDEFAWPKQRKEDQALARMFQLARQAIVPGAWLDTQGRPISNLFHLVYLTRHVLGPHRKAFDRWLEEAGERILARGDGKSFKARTGNVARDRTWGHPLPPPILERDVKPAALLGERAGLTAELKRNRFYAPAPSYLSKLSRADAAIVKGLGVKRVEDLADHAASELEAIDLWSRMILTVELAAKGLAFEPEPKAPRAKAAKAVKPTKPGKPAAITPPSFVPAELLASKPSFTWGGDLTVLQQGKALDGFVRTYGRHTYCAILALVSGVSQWCASAFAAVRDVSEHIALARLHFLVMEPAGFAELALAPLFERKRPTQPKEDGALAAAFMHAARPVHPKVAIGYDIKGTPVYELAQLVTLARLVLAAPHREAFDAWLAAADKRIKRLGATPYAAKSGKPQRDKIWGHPLPPEILERDVEARELMPLRRPFLTSLRASKHPFLR